MKIGILTQPLRNNYGGLVQNYALQQILKGMGHEVETVDWKEEYSRMRIILVQAKKTLLSYLRNDVEKPSYKPTAAEYAVISRNTRRFVERYISVCPQRVSHEEDFRKVDSQFGYDAYVVGSDQVWRPDYNAFLASMFLSFTDREDVKRVAYAASFGTSEWEFTPQMTEVCARLSKRFDLITVREESGVLLCKKHLGVEAKFVLDPTLLLNREDYEKLVLTEQEQKSTGTLFHYILDPSDDKRGLIERVASQQGLQPFTVMPKYYAAKNNTKWNVKHHIEDFVTRPVTSWLRGFMDAEMTVIDSFHGAVFSIVFNKPFWVIGNSKRGNARFESLLGLLGLQDRMISLDHTPAIGWNKPIDWLRVNDILKREKERSIALLREGLA